MCHRHTPSLKRNLSTKTFAKSAATCFLPLTKDFNTFYPGPANLVGLFSGSSRPRPAPLLLTPRLFAVRWSPACPFLRQSAPRRSCLRLSLSVCLLFPSCPSLPAAAPAPVPACLPFDGHQLALSCARRSLSVPLCDGSLPLPTSSRQAHRPKPPGPPSVSVRLAPPSSVLSGFRRLVSPRSRTCPSLHFPACPCSRSRTCAFLRQSTLSAPVRPVRPGPCAPGPFLRTRASENHRGE